MSGKREKNGKSAPEISPSMNYVIAVFMSWLIPGMGHWIMGYRLRACILGALLLGSFWWGEVTAGGYAVTRAEHNIFFIGQIGNGLSALVANRLQWADVMPSMSTRDMNTIDTTIPPRLTIGILLTSVSGLLNMLLILYVMDPRSWQALKVRDDQDLMEGKKS